MVVMWFGDVDKYEGIDDGFDDRAGEDVDDVGVGDTEGGLILIGVNNKAGGGLCTSAHRLQWIYLKTRTHVFSLQKNSMIFCAF